MRPICKEREVRMDACRCLGANSAADGGNTRAEAPPTLASSCPPARTTSQIVHTLGPLFPRGQGRCGPRDCLCTRPLGSGLCGHLLLHLSPLPPQPSRRPPSDAGSTRCRARRQREKTSTNIANHPANPLPAGLPAHLPAGRNIRTVKRAAKVERVNPSIVRPAP